MEFDKALGFQSIPGLISEVECRAVREALEQLPPAYWSHRAALDPGRGYAGETCDYLWAGPKTLPEALYASLIDMAPKHEDLTLYEVCANKYAVGNHIGRHRDRDQCVLNMTVALQAKGDGVIVDGVFYPDRVGAGNILYRTGPAHSVPPVLHERYVLIFLYTEKVHDQRHTPG